MSVGRGFGKGVDLIQAVMDDLMWDDLQMVVIGTGEWQYEEMFRAYAGNFPAKMTFFVFLVCIASPVNAYFRYGLAVVFTVPFYAAVTIFAMMKQKEKA